MIFQGKGENNFPAHKLRQKPKAAKGRALYQISGFCHHIWSICRSATAWIWHHYSHRCASVTLGHRYRNTNPRLNAKYTKDTSMLNNQHGRVSCQKCPGYANQMRAVCDFDSLPMYILTNSRQTNGASAILYPGVLSSLAKSSAAICCSYQAVSMNFW